MVAAKTAHKMTPATASRRAALDMLNLIRGGAPLDAALEDCRSFNALEGSDRAFAHALVMTVLRRQGSLDALLAPYLERPLPARATKVMDILRLAAAQSAVMETPDHAAVDNAVALSKEFRETEGYAGLVNAIARKIAKGGEAAIKKFPIRSDTPGWLWRSWERAYGPVAAKAIAETHRRQPPLDLTPKSGVDAAGVAASVGGKVLPTGSIRIESAHDITALDGFAHGEWWVQDAAAALAARLLGDVAGKTVFDLCAAPGGKTMQLAAAGAKVIAVDSSGHRLKLVAENLKRTGLAAETVKADILTWVPTAKADAVLLDAPCSATGTIRRHPDILWTCNADEVGALARLQTKMIDRALAWLKPGGLLVYSTCSLQLEEGERQIEGALTRHAGLKRMPADPSEVAGLHLAVSAAGDLRTLPSMWPEIGGLDGFFIARMAFRG